MKTKPAIVESFNHLPKTTLPARRFATGSKRPKSYIIAGICILLLSSVFLHAAEMELNRTNENISDKCNQNKTTGSSYAKENDLTEDKPVAMLQRQKLLDNGSELADFDTPYADSAFDDSVMAGGVLSPGTRAVMGLKDTGTEKPSLIESKAFKWFFALLIILLLLPILLKFLRRTPETAIRQYYKMKLSAKEIEKEVKRDFHKDAIEQNSLSTCAPQRGLRESKVIVTDEGKLMWIKNPKDDTLENDGADSPTLDEKKTTGVEDTGIEDTKKNPQGLITCGYIFAFLGGVLGMGLGIVLLINQRKYTPNAKLHGVIILVLGLFFMTFWKMATGLQ